MFYSEAILSERTPIGTLWFSANNDARITKSKVLQTDLPGVIHDLIDGKGLPAMALRLNGQLLIGATKIYGRKGRYLFEDCSRLHVQVQGTNVVMEEKQRKAVGEKRSVVKTVEGEKGEDVPMNEKENLDPIEVGRRDSSLGPTGLKAFSPQPLGSPGKQPEE